MENRILSSLNRQKREKRWRNIRYKDDHHNVQHLLRWVWHQHKIRMQSLQLHYNLLFASYIWHQLFLHPVKFFAFIIIVILLAQSLLPCADKVCTENKGKTLITREGHQQKNATDECPPLCSCTCCSSFSSNLSFVSYTSIQVFSLVDFNAEYISPAIQKIALPIWQPPQLI